MIEIIAQILGILALVANIICYQMNDKKKLLGMQILASILFTVNLLLKGAFSGVILNVHAIVRLLFYAFRDEHKWMKSNWWVAFFAVTAAGCVFLTYQSPVDIIALIGTIATVVSVGLFFAVLIGFVTFFVSVFAGTAPEVLKGFEVKEIYVYLFPAVIALFYFGAALVYYLVNIEKAFSKLTK
jgi:hypothetical protein